MYANQRDAVFTASYKTARRDTEGKMDQRRNHPVVWGLRNWIQLAVLVLTIGIGLQFYFFVRQAAGSGTITIARPGGVEGFLPIGALMGWKHFLVTGEWDAIHPAAMVILAFAGMMSFLLRKSFCSWFCPVGTLSEWLWKTGERLFGRNYPIPPWLDYPLRSLKYGLLLFFVYIIAGMATADIALFLQSPYYRMADVKMLHFFTRMSQTTAIVLSALLLLSLFFRNFWCRYLCPYGALMGILALCSPMQIRRNRTTCVQCQRCLQVCPAHLQVHKKARILSPECSGCMDCSVVCPVPDTLVMTSPGRRGLNLRISWAALFVVALFLGTVTWAKSSGRWESRLSPQEFRMALKQIDGAAMQHPSVQFGRQ
jgi:polyferredoxin